MVVLTDDEFRCMDRCTGTVELALLVLRTAAFSAPAALAIPLADEEFRCMAVLPVDGAFTLPLGLLLVIMDG